MGLEILWSSWGWGWRYDDNFLFRSFPISPMEKEGGPMSIKCIFYHDENEQSVEKSKDLIKWTFALLLKCVLGLSHSCLQMLAVSNSCHIKPSPAKKVI